MNKKKFASLLAAGALTLGLVGGSLAWFTSQDSVTNSFTTGKTQEEGKDGIKVVETFDSEKAQNLTPGTRVEKDVQVKNTATYDQFVRVRFIKAFNKEGLDTNYINLVFTNKLGTDWLQDGEWDYYIGKLSASQGTTQLLDAVILNSAAGNEYKGVGFNVKVEAEGIQASNNAYTQWVDGNSVIGKKLAAIQ